MSLYQLLLSVEVAHDYFYRPEGLVLSFRPDAQTADWLDRAKCVVHVLDNRLQILFDADAKAGGICLAATGAPVELRFGLVAEDPMFMEYTADLAPVGRPPVVLSPNDGAAGKDGLWMLTPPADPAMPWAGPRAQLVIGLPLAGDLSDAGRRYKAQLTPRTAIWKYVLLDDWAEVTPCVVDARQGVAFLKAKTEPLADGRERLAILCDRALPIKERCDQQFQLRALTPDGGPGAVLINRLPGAAPGRLALDLPDKTLVSEIYVAR